MRMHCVVHTRSRAQADEQNTRKPWQRPQWSIPAVEAEFVTWLDDRLDWYEVPDDAKRPTVSFDETSKPLIAEVCPPASPAGMGQAM
jgi:hypothetical protein